MKPPRLSLAICNTPSITPIPTVIIPLSELMEQEMA